ncbi:hypothetical protein NL676_034801 [Syzygium grande]|nr:hypothetical protein NL676_034801 [Syzygium grande]
MVHSKSLFPTPTLAPTPLLGVHSESNSSTSEPESPQNCLFLRGLRLDLDLDWVVYVTRLHWNSDLLLLIGSSKNSSSGTNSGSIYCSYGVRTSVHLPGLLCFCPSSSSSSSPSRIASRSTSIGSYPL